MALNVLAMAKIQPFLPRQTSSLFNFVKQNVNMVALLLSVR